MTNGHPAAYKATWLPAGTSENGPVHLDQRSASTIICEREEEEEEGEGEGEGKNKPYNLDTGGVNKGN